MAAQSGADASALQLLEEIAATMRAGNFARAALLSEQALARGLNHPLPYQARGLYHDMQGRAQEALADFRQAHSLDPSDATAANGLALCLGRQGQLAESMAMFDVALASDPGLVSTHFHRGWILEMHKDFAGARQAYLGAASLAPGYAAAWAGLASVGREMGNWNESRQAAMRALSLDTRQLNALFSLAYAEMQACEFVAAERHLRAALGTPGLDMERKCTALGLLGDALDRQDKTAEAFSFYAAKNEERGRLYQASEKQFDMRTLLLGVTAHFERSYPAQWILDNEAPHGGGAKEHIFLLGFPRSGTTLLEQVLGAHPDVVTLEEAPLLDAVAEDLLRDEGGLARLAQMQGQALAQARTDYWQRMGALGALTGGKLVVDKLPLNTIKLPLIAKFFPRAKILFVVRDPRDVVFSCFRRHFQINASTSPFLTLEGVAHYYDDVMRLGEMARAQLPLPFFIHRHEDLVHDFEGHMRRLCAFAQLEWTDRFRDFAALAREREIRSISADQVRRGLYSDGMDQWRRYGAQLRPILPLLRPWAEKFGYVLD